MALLSALSWALIFFTRVRFTAGKSALAMVFSLLSHMTISSTGCFENLPSDYFYFCGLMALLHYIRAQNLPHRETFVSNQRTVNHTVFWDSKFGNNLSS